MQGAIQTSIDIESAPRWTEPLEHAEEARMRIWDSMRE
jgi:hypothetical protein